MGILILFWMAIVRDAVSSNFRHVVFWHESHFSLRVDGLPPVAGGPLDDGDAVALAQAQQIGMVGVRVEVEQRLHSRHLANAKSQCRVQTLEAFLKSKYLYVDCQGSSFMFNTNTWSELEL